MKQFYSNLSNGVSLKKTSIYFKLLGDLDELNCAIGMSKSLWLIEKPNVSIHSNILNTIQCLLMDISNFIENPPWHELKPIKGDVNDLIEKWIYTFSIDVVEINKIEKLTDYLNSSLVLKNRYIPGNNTLVSSIHICRSITRRCERNYIEFLDSNLVCYNVYNTIDIQFNTIQMYLNKLSNFFFILSHTLSVALDVTEELYSKSKK